MNRKPVRTPKPALKEWSPDEVAYALMECHGLSKPTAQFLGVNHQTLLKYLKDHEELKAVRLEAREEIAAQAKHNIASAIFDDNPKAKKERLENSRWWLLNSPEGKAMGFGFKDNSPMMGQMVQIHTTEKPDNIEAFVKERKVQREEVVRAAQEIAPQ